jgi:hypothetical protein
MYRMCSLNLNSSVGLSAVCMRGFMSGILVGRCHFVRVNWCFEVSYVKYYGLCCWYGNRFGGWYCERDLLVFV